MPELVECPEPGCQLAAEVLDRVVVGSTSGPVELVKTLCLRRHLLVAPRQPRHR